jgi:hypothetical protein
MFTSSVKLVGLLSNYLEHEIDEEGNVSKLCEIIDETKAVKGEFSKSLSQVIYKIYVSRLPRKFIDDSSELCLLLAAKSFDDGSNLQALPLEIIKEFISRAYFANFAVKYLPLEERMLYHVGYELFKEYATFKFGYEEDTRLKESLEFLRENLNPSDDNIFRELKYL